VPTGVFKSDYYGKPQSRTDRLRASVHMRDSYGGRETQSYAGRSDGGRGEPRPDEHEADVDPADTSDGLPTRGTQP